MTELVPAFAHFVLHCTKNEWTLSGSTSTNDWSYKINVAPTVVKGVVYKYHM